MTILPCTTNPGIPSLERALAYGPNFTSPCTLDKIPCSIHYKAKVLQARYVQLETQYSSTEPPTMCININTGTGTLALCLLHKV